MFGKHMQRLAMNLSLTQTKKTMCENTCLSSLTHATHCVGKLEPGTYIDTQTNKQAHSQKHYTS